MARLIYLIALACAVWVIYDVWTNRKSLSQGSKVLWTISALFFSIFTAIIYALLGRK